MVDKQILQNMLDCIHDNTQIRLFLITRHNKPDVKKSAKVLDKYDFKASQIDVVSDIQSYFRGILKQQLEKALSDDNREMREYDIMCDDDGIYTYALNNALSFSDVVSQQLLSGRDLPSVNSLKEIQEDLWGYCWKATSDNQTFYSFRKASKGKVSTDHNDGLFKKLTAKFDSSDAELKKFIDDTITFDDKVDCVYIDGQFYVLRKKSFEALMGLEEELRANAELVLDVIEATDLVKGLDALKKELLESRVLLKTLASIVKKKTHEGLNSNEIEKMRNVLKQMERKDLKFTDEGQVKLENMADLRDFVKLLNDYYKRGLVTGSYYGTNSGRKLDVE